MKLQNLKMKPKLIGLFLIVSVIPLVIIIILASILSSDALLTQAYNQLDSIRAIKTNQIQELFTQSGQQLKTLTNTTNVFRSEVIRKLIAVRQSKKKNLLD
ncbi:MAG: hypothetical protein COB67_07690, partial [SAR324 cluster bacterium]